MDPVLEAASGQREALLRELTAAWEDTRALLQAAETGDDLGLVIRQWERKRPIARALSAFEKYAAAIADFARTLPAEVQSTGKAYLAANGLRADLSPIDNLRAFFSPPGNLRLREVFEDYELANTKRRSPIDEDLLGLLENACLALPELAVARRGGTPMDWLSRCRAFEDDAAAILHRYRRWADSSPEHLHRALHLAAPLSESRRTRLQNLAHQRLAVWWRRQRSVASLLDLDLRTAALRREILVISENCVHSVFAEHEMVRSALRALADYLERWNPDTQPFQPPGIEGRIASSEERLDEWRARISAAAARNLPESVDCFQPSSRGFAFADSWRTLEPRRTFHETLAQTGAPAMREALDEAASENLALARQGDRVREVVEFGIQTVVDDPATGRIILDEAIANTRRLMDDSLSRPSASMQSLEGACREAVTAMLDDFDSAFRPEFTGISTAAARRMGIRMLARARSRGETGLKAAGAGTAKKVKAAWERFLVFIGWSMPSRAAAQPVVVRPDLDTIFSLQFGERQLPLIYKRLFRLAPVEEPRYLVGREQEMRGIEQAVELWESGRFAAVLVVGARGSGKTSLLNCAVRSVLASRDFEYSRFPARFTSPAALESFLRDLLATPPETSLAAHLAGRRRIVILEELDRCFLRRVGGLDGIRWLLAFVQQTAGSVLWIFSINDHGCRYLDPAADLSSAFTHVINVTSMSPANLRKAILQRHHLSGLRLNFAPPPAADPRITRLRRLFGIEGDGAALFFDELYRQSGGVFRSASELWQSNIERVEAGAVQMRFPVRPQHAPLLRSLDQSDHFTLHAILQHGSLDEDELSQALAEPVMNSAARMERLRALGLLEKDPDYPGCRVRPEARMVVNEALGGVNLI
jgi:hypothetical protein